MASWEQIQAVATSRYKLDVPGALVRAATNQGLAASLQGATDINGVATKLFGPGTAANVQSTEWANIPMSDQIIFALSIWPAP